MKKIILSAAVFTILATVTFASPISIKDLYLGWFEPSDLNAWTTPWMLPILYKEAANTTVLNVYYRNENNDLNVIGAYGFYHFIGGDYMRATINASYTTFTMNRYTVGIAVPNAGFDIRYTNVDDGSQSYYSEIGFDVEFIYNWAFWPFSLWYTNTPESNIFSYVKIFNFVRYVKPAYPLNSNWESIYALDYLFRTVWILPQFALIYDQYTGMDEISYNYETYNALEMLVKINDNLILRGGVNFQNVSSAAMPSVNIGTNLNFNNFTINADYQQILAEPTGTFAVSAGMNF
ncbi:MAG: hypothetical protein M1542_05165 [Thermotogae bacterium]|jgi:hypothetical protein|nr:hypothetical protein [Thermotogota bacterium]MCL5032623.1 hypothetical protein [Thermotogota bacterium]